MRAANEIPILPTEVRPSGGDRWGLGGVVHRGHDHPRVLGPSVPRRCVAVFPSPFPVKHSPAFARHGVGGRARYFPDLGWKYGPRHSRKRERKSVCRARWVGGGVQLPTGGKAETMDLRGVVPMRKPPGLTTRRRG